jgi:hypothetical protein
MSCWSSNVKNRSSATLSSRMSFSSSPYFRYLRTTGSPYCGSYRNRLICWLLTESLGTLLPAPAAARTYVRGTGSSARSAGRSTAGAAFGEPWMGAHGKSAFQCGPDPKGSRGPQAAGDAQVATTVLRFAGAVRHLWVLKPSPASAWSKVWPEARHLAWSRVTKCADASRRLACQAQ